MASRLTPTEPQRLFVQGSGASQRGFGRPEPLEPPNHFNDVAPPPSRSQDGPARPRMTAI
eukprot:5595385-Pyramimonas_sp.AAC.1